MGIQIMFLLEADDLSKGLKYVGHTMACPRAETSILVKSTSFVTSALGQNTEVWQGPSRLL